MNNIYRLYFILLLLFVSFFPDFIFILLLWWPCHKVTKFTLNTFKSIEIHFYDCQHVGEMRFLVFIVVVFIRMAIIIIMITVIIMMTMIIVRRHNVHNDEYGAFVYLSAAACLNNYIFFLLLLLFLLFLLQFLCCCHWVLFTQYFLILCCIYECCMHTHVYNLFLSCSFRKSNHKIITKFCLTF